MAMASPMVWPGCGHAKHIWTYCEQPIVFQFLFPKQVFLAALDILCIRLRDVVLCVNTINFAMLLLLMPLGEATVSKRALGDSRGFHWGSFVVYLKGSWEDRGMSAAARPRTT